MKITLKTRATVELLKDCIHKHPSGKDVGIRLSESEATEVSVYCDEMIIPAYYVCSWGKWATFSVAKDIPTLKEHERLR